MPAWYLFALACLAAFVALGVRVAHGAPLRLDREAVVLRGFGTPAAAVFTALGRWWAILAIAVLAATVAVKGGADVTAVFWLVGSQAVSQAAVNGCKRLFRRTRPEGWLLYREPDLSYPSGHATTAVVFFGSLLFAAAQWPPLHGAPAIVVDTILTACIVGIPWSRLALGAHFATDVIGGALFGSSWTCLTIGAASVLHVVHA